MSKKARSRIGKKETKSKKTMSPVPTPEPVSTPVCAPVPEPVPTPVPTPVCAPVREEPLVAEVPSKPSVLDWLKRKLWAIRFYGQL